MSRVMLLQYFSFRFFQKMIGTLDKIAAQYTQIPPYLYARLYGNLYFGCNQWSRHSRDMRK